MAPQVAYRRIQLNRDGLRPADLLALQRTVGNRAVQRMLAKANDEQQDETAEEDSERTVQTKLTVGAAKDVHEQEADRVAGQVMTMPDAAAQRPNRTGLPDGLKSGVESLSGMSLDNVNVHYNSSQPAQLNALAYTQGSDIHVAPGQERHLPHEAWHVVQQAQGRVQPTMQMKDGMPVNDDEGLEREADVMGAKALSNGPQGQGTHEKQGPQRDTVPTGTLHAPAIAEQVVSRVANPDTGNEYTSAEIEDLFDKGNLIVTYSHPFKGTRTKESGGLNSTTTMVDTFHNYSFKLARSGVVIGVLHLHYDGDPATGNLTGSKIKVTDYGQVLTRQVSMDLNTAAVAKIPAGARAN